MIHMLEGRASARHWPIVAWQGDRAVFATCERKLIARRAGQIPPRCRIARATTLVRTPELA
jgi:hypothetical protein